MKKDETLYMQIYNRLLDDVLGGVYQSHQRIPSENEVSDLFHVSRITAKKALNMLSEDGVIYRKAGLGSFVESTEKIERFRAGKNGSNRMPLRLIGLIIEDFPEDFGTNLLSGMEFEAERLGYSIVIKRSYGSQEREQENIATLISMGVSGIALMPAHGKHYSPEVLKLVIEGFPMIFLDRYLRGIDAPCVMTDNAAAMDMVVGHLQALGHTNIGLITHPVTSATSLEERTMGYKQSLRARGLHYSSDDIIIIPKDAADLSEQLGDFLTQHAEMSAVIVTQYLLALQTAKFCAQLGRQIPRELSVACFDGPNGAFDSGRFTHVRQPEREVGISAMQQLFSLIEGQSVEPFTRLQAQLIVGASTAPVD